MDKDALTQILDNIIANLEEQDINLNQTPALFRWRHPINGQYEFQLLIRLIGEDDEPEEGVIVH